MPFDPAIQRAKIGYDTERAAGMADAKQSATGIPAICDRKMQDSPPASMPPLTHPTPATLTPGPTPLLAALCSCALLMLLPASRAQDVEAVASKVAKDYVRRQLPDGSFKPETYVFGKGDNWGARVDPTIDKVDFMDIARILSVALAKKGYLPAGDPKSSDELIMVSWGTTEAPEHATESNNHVRLQLANEQRERALEMLRSSGGGSRGAQLVAEELMADADGAVLSATIGVQAENQRR